MPCIARLPVLAPSTITGNSAISAEQMIFYIMFFQMSTKKLTHHVANMPFSHLALAVAKVFM